MTASHIIARRVQSPVSASLTVAGAMQDGHSFSHRLRDLLKWINAEISQRRVWSDIPASNLRNSASVALVGSAFTPTLAVRLGHSILPRLGWGGANPASLFFNGIAQAFHNTRRNRSYPLHSSYLLCWPQSSTTGADKCAGISRQIVKSTKP